MEKKNKIEVNIQGNIYTLRSSESEEYIQKVALYVDKKMNEISASNHILSTMMSAILTAVNVTDDMFKTKDVLKEANIQISKISSELDATKQKMQETIQEFSKLKEKYTEQQFELVKTKTQLKDLQVIHKNSKN